MFHSLNMLSQLKRYKRQFKRRLTIDTWDKVATIISRLCIVCIVLLALIQLLLLWAPIRTIMNGVEQLEGTSQWRVHMEMK
ncbi:hypothetical protein [Paenibacillus sp. 481]|uniref:hypothetical protein n=1 Tax=Paenibacillus sp. 481 TaxID=2835869 RepID=UPI001E3C34EF|nr:hypothetical protein [Paenibacillus sp. 481]UHA72943.1 hypothetical protein KIK04_20380 [Paenibacillus sp. 481]